MALRGEKKSNHEELAVNRRYDMRGFFIGFGLFASMMGVTVAAGAQGKPAGGAGNGVIEQRLTEQEKQAALQALRIAEQEKRLAEQDKLLAEQKARATEQEKRLATQEQRAEALEKRLQQQAAAAEIQRADVDALRSAAAEAS